MRKCLTAISKGLQVGMCRQVSAGQCGSKAAAQHQLAVHTGGKGPHDEAAAALVELEAICNGEHAREYMVCALRYSLSFLVVLDYIRLFLVYSKLSGMQHLCLQPPS